MQVISERKKQGFLSFFAQGGVFLGNFRERTNLSKGRLQVYFLVLKMDFLWNHVIVNYM